jgi:hypothetical protein
VNLALFLENNNISYYLAIPYRSASPLLGDPFFKGLNKEEVNADYVVEEKISGCWRTYRSNPPR